MVEKLCQNYGEKITEYGGVPYYDFPLVEKLAKKDVEEKLRQENFGYRAGFIVKSAAKILEKGGEGWLHSLKKVGYEQAKSELRTLPGIGRKVKKFYAKCYEVSRCSCLCAI